MDSRKHGSSQVPVYIPVFAHFVDSQQVSLRHLSSNVLLCQLRIWVNAWRIVDKLWRTKVKSVDSGWLYFNDFNIGLIIDDWCTSCHLGLNGILNTTSKESHPVAQIPDTKSLEPHNSRCSIVTSVTRPTFLSYTGCCKRVNIGHYYQCSWGYVSIVLCSFLGITRQFT